MAQIKARQKSYIKPRPLRQYASPIKPLKAPKDLIPPRIFFEKIAHKRPTPLTMPLAHICLKYGEASLRSTLN